MKTSSITNPGGPTLDVSTLLEMMKTVPAAPPDPLSRVTMIRCHENMLAPLRDLVREYRKLPMNEYRAISVEASQFCPPGVALGMAPSGESVLVIGSKK